MKTSFGLAGMAVVRLELQWRWYDLWIGAYWDRAARVLYVCPLPTVVIRIEVDGG